MEFPYGEISSNFNFKIFNLKINSNLENGMTAKLSHIQAYTNSNQFCEGRNNLLKTQLSSSFQASDNHALTKDKSVEFRMAKDV